MANRISYWGDIYSHFYNINNVECVKNTVIIEGINRHNKFESLKIEYIHNKVAILIAKKLKNLASL